MSTFQTSTLVCFLLPFLHIAPRRSSSRHAETPLIRLSSEKGKLLVVKELSLIDMVG